MRAWYEMQAMYKGRKVSRRYKQGDKALRKMQEGR